MNRYFYDSTGRRERKEGEGRGREVSEERLGKGIPVFGTAGKVTGRAEVDEIVHLFGFTQCS